MSLAVVHHRPKTDGKARILVPVYPKRGWPKALVNRPLQKEQVSTSIIGQGLAENTPAPQVLKMVVVEVEPSCIDDVISSRFVGQDLEPTITFISGTTQCEAWPSAAAGVGSSSRHKDPMRDLHDRRRCASPRCYSQRVH